MIEIKTGVDSWVPVRLVDVTGTPVTGVTFGSVTVSIRAADTGPVDTYTPTSQQWLEVNSGAFAGTGVYAVKILGSSIGLPQGSTTYAVAASGAVTYVGSVKVVLQEESDTYLRMRELQEGRWKIHTTGPDANRLVLYGADGVTPIQKWDLYDSSGTATAGVGVFERVPTVVIT